MKNLITTINKFLIIISAFSILSACGGGGGANNSTDNSGNSIVYQLTTTNGYVFGLFKTQKSSASIGMLHAFFLTSPNSGNIGSLFTKYTTGVFNFCTVGQDSGNGSFFFESSVTPLVKTQSIIGTICVNSTTTDRLITQLVYTPGSGYESDTLNATTVPIKSVSDMKNQIAAMKTESPSLYNARVYFLPYLNLSSSDQTKFANTTIKTPAEIKGQTYGSILESIYNQQSVSLGSPNGITFSLSPSFKQPNDARDMDFTLSANSGNTSINMSSCHSLVNYTDLNNNLNSNFYLVMDKVCSTPQGNPTIEALGGGLLNPQVVDLIASESNVTQGGNAIITAFASTAVTESAVINFVSSNTSIAANPASCTIDVGNNSCSTILFGESTGVGTVNVTPSATGFLSGTSANITFNVIHRLYIDNGIHAAINPITRCDIQISGILTNCTNMSNPMGINHAAGIAFYNNKAYIANILGTNSVLMCDVDQTSGDFSNCSTIVSGLHLPSGIAFSGSQAFVTLSNVSAFNSYPVNSNGTFGSATAIPMTGKKFGGGPLPILNSDGGSRIYLGIESNGFNLDLCSITNGSCNGLTAISSDNISDAIAFNNNLLYISAEDQFGVANIIKCSLNSNGTLNVCDYAATNVPDSTTSGMVFYGSHAYLSTSSPFDSIIMCNVESNGNLTGCTNNSGAINIDSPAALTIY